MAGCRQHADNHATQAPPQTPIPDTAPAGAQKSGTADMFDPTQNPTASTGVALNLESLTASQKKYGIAPKRDHKVTYAPEVIVMEQGDQAITAVDDDGMTWHFDASSPHVSEFQEGKIIMATGRAVGRIGQLTRSGGSVTVKLAPVQITEVIKDGHFIFDGDVDATQMIVYEAPSFPSILDLKAPSSTSMNWEGWADSPFLKAAVELPSTLGSTQAPNLTSMTPPQASQVMTLSGGAFKTFPIIGSDRSVGVGFGYHKSGLNMEAWGTLGLTGAHIKFALDIQNFKIVTAGMNLGGASSFRMKLQVWSDEKETTINASQLVELPADIYLPIPIGGVPLGLTFHTSFTFSTAVSAKRSVMTADAEYTAEGDIFIGWKDGSPQISPFAKTYAKNSLANNLQGVSVGINSLALGFKVEPMIGIGAFGFNTGVYVGVSFGGSAVRQSDAAMRQCRAGYMNGVINGGVGYQLPAAFVKIINGILSVFTKYQISGSGHLLEVPDHRFMDLGESIPPGCASQGQKT